MPIWVLWLITCGVLLVLEIFTVSFLLFFPGVGAFLAFLCAVLGASLNVQVAVFAISTILMLLFIRPIVTKFFKTKDVKMNSNSLIGKNAVVVKEISNLQAKGQVKISGELWSAKSSSDDVIEEGAAVIIEKIDGVKLLVKKV